ncbi:MAG: UMP kinase, partial [Candidatus Woesearchaeota archaeon]|nr:UMP kinase [Candidatus Woesearchaeota archaeon]
MKNETVVISLGGSIIVPEDIDVQFLKRFRNTILKHIRRGKRFIIIAGGGRTARIYMNAAEKI